MPFPPPARPSWVRSASSTARKAAAKRSRARGSSCARCSSALSSAPENPAHDRAARNSRGSRLSRLTGRELGHRLSELLQRQGLEPDPPWSGQQREEYPVAAEDLVRDPLDRRDRELHGVLEQPDVGGMHAQALARLQVVGEDLAAQLAPCSTLAGDLLKPEAVAAEEPGAEALLNPDRELHATQAAHESVTVAEVPHSRLGRDVDREDRPGEARRERHHARSPLRGELAHEDRAATDGAFEDAADAAAATHLRRRLHDDRLRHP